MMEWAWVWWWTGVGAGVLVLAAWWLMREEGGDDE